MSAPRVEMHRLEELVRLYRLGTGVRERARLLQISTTTERLYRRAIDAAGLLEGDLEQLPEARELRAAVAAVMPPPLPRPIQSTMDPWMPLIGEAVERGVGAQAIYDRLRRCEADFHGSLSAVKRAVRRIRQERPVRATDVVIRVETAPGQVAQVDFGYAGRFFDPDTGRVRRAWLFVMVLCHSRHMYGQLVWDQRAPTWVRLHVSAFKWFGGAVDTLVPDNLKAAVVRAAFGLADREQLSLNRTYMELARYYGCKIDPTPPRQPQKKGKVESAVKYVTNNFLATASSESLAATNEDLKDWLVKIAGDRIHGTTGRRVLDAFAEERAALRALPALPYENVIWKEATVHRDGRIIYDGRTYTVPWPLLGQRTWIRATDTSIYVYAHDERVATHQRVYEGRGSINEAHLPEHRRDLAHRSEEYWLARANQIGATTGAYIKRVLDTDPVISRLREAQAMVTYLEQFPPDRAERACKRAQHFGNYSYQGLKRILVHALDLDPLPDECIRHGALVRPRFARHQVPTPIQGEPS